jgi:hypothetical protein
LPKHDRKDRTAVTGQPWQESQDRPAGQDRRDTSGGARKRGQVGLTGKCRSASTEQKIQDGQNMTARA